MADSLTRIALVAHGFPPHERTGVENHVEALARALAERGMAVEVFAACNDRARRELETWREERSGYAVTRVAAHRSPGDAREALDRPGMHEVFGAWLDEREISLVHFHHVVKLGVSLITEASRRGLPVVYTAHDFYALSSRYTLLAPDLSPIEPGDLDLEVRADLAIELLNGIERLGDHQGMVLAEDLEPRERAALTAILRGDPTEAGVSRARLREVGALRRDVELRRRAAFRRVDLMLSPTRFVADALARGGLGDTRIELDPYGIDLRPFERSGAARSSRASGDPMTFGYLGGLSKHKGVHLLLDAFAALGGGSELLVFGDSSDRAYVASLERRAAATGAKMRGAYDVADVSEVLAEVDVVVVPSIWRENAPFVIREAFAARRPVIASSIGGLSESVRDGVDGILFGPGDVRALTAALRRVVDHPDLLAKLERGIAPVRSIGQQAAGLIDRYRALVQEKRRAVIAPLPAHLSAFAERARALSALHPEELAARVFSGLEDLGRMLCGPESNAAAHIARAWHGAGSIGETLTSLSRERDWLRGVVQDQKAAALSLDERARRSTDLESDNADLARAHAELVQQTAWLSTSRAAAARELEWLRQSLDSKSKEAEWLERTIVDRNAAVDEVARQLAAQSEAVAQLRAEITQLRAGNAAHLARFAEVERLAVERARQLDESERGRESLERERDRQKELVSERDREIGRRVESERTLKTDAERARAEIESLGARLVELEDELRWRRSEMQVVQRTIKERMFPLLSKDLRWRALHWPQSEQDATSSQTDAIPPECAP